MNWKEFLEDFKKSVEGVSQKYNVTLNPKTIRYDDTTFRFTVEGVRNQEGKDTERVLFEKHCLSFGVSPSDYRKELTMGGKKYKLIGFNPRARKFPLLLEGENGEKMKSSTLVLRRGV